MGDGEPEIGTLSSVAQGPILVVASTTKLEKDVLDAD
jgi:hypothetical protein